MMVAGKNLQWLQFPCHGRHSEDTLKMIDMIPNLTAHVFNFSLSDKQNSPEALKVQVYESATCTNLSPATLQPLKIFTSPLSVVCGRNKETHKTAFKIFYSALKTPSETEITVCDYSIYLLNR